jgi:hypothetical protein
MPEQDPHRSDLAHALDRFVQTVIQELQRRKR